MSIKIALAGNPNCGKTTLFNALTGSNQYVGNWPGVTVEKKEGKLRKHDGVIITDLPGIYSLSPYTLEEVVARNYLLNERPDAILNIIDGTNLERNLYLTTQLTELGIPVVVAINMMDVVRKNGDKINTNELARELGCKVIEISALKGDRIMEAAEAAIEMANGGKTVPMHTFSGPVEHAIAHIEEAELNDMPEDRQRWYAIKIFERDEKVLADLKIEKAKMEHIEKDIAAVEKELDDDAESIITNERYIYIASVIKGCYKKKKAGALSVSDKIDRVVTNRWLALPIFAIIMFFVYFVSVTTVGTYVTDWTNDGLFGDGYYFLTIGRKAYNNAMDDFAEANIWTEEYKATLQAAKDADVIGADEVLSAVEDGDFEAFDEAYGYYADEIAEAGFDITTAYDEAMESEEVPDNADFGLWVPGIPVLLEKGLTKIHCAEWLQSLLIDGIVGGVGAVLGFVPQMIVLFFFLAFLEACGYMSRIAFVMDRIFRRFGLSGKSFIPMLIGTGCGVPGVMSSRTIENERDRRMTIMTTTFIPCGAKLPIIALIASSLFHGAWWVAPSAYFLGVFSIVISGIMLKKTKMFSGEPAPFVMELPAYHMPTPSNIWHSIWERASSFMKKAGTIILLSSILVWTLSHFGNAGGHFGFAVDMELESSILGYVGGALCWIFKPLGFGNTIATVATFMGLVAKEEVVGVFGVLDFVEMTKISGYSFLIFNLLCAPCFAAIGAISREMNNPKWTAFAIAYQCAFAYTLALIFYQFGMLFSGKGNAFGVIVAILLIAGICYLLFRPYKESKKLSVKA